MFKGKYEPGYQYRTHKTRPFAVKIKNKRRGGEGRGALKAIRAGKQSAAPCYQTQDTPLCLLLTIECTQKRSRSHTAVRSPATVSETLKYPDNAFSPRPSLTRLSKVRRAFPPHTPLPALRTPLKIKRPQR